MRGGREAYCMSSEAERLTCLYPEDLNEARREAQSRRMMCENDVAEYRIQVEVDLFTRLVVFPTSVSPFTTLSAHPLLPK